MKQNQIIELLEYFRDGLADVEAGSGEEEPKLKELTDAITELSSTVLLPKENQQPMELKEVYNLSALVDGLNLNAHQKALASKEYQYLISCRDRLFKNPIKH